MDPQPAKGGPASSKHEGAEISLPFTVVLFCFLLHFENTNKDGAKVRVLLLYPTECFI